MTTPSEIIAAYDRAAPALAERYEAVAAAAVHQGLAELLPRPPGLVLDVGAGSGRDAAWLAGLGYETVAAEPSAGMRAEGQRRHGDAAIRWIASALPDLAEVHRLGLGFDLVLVSAVWMHVRPAERARAFRKLVTLLKPGGLLWLTLRDGPQEPERAMWPAPLGEIEQLARDHGLSVLRVCPSADRIGRPEVRWTGVCLRLPDDGSGALALLRGIILNDAKSSTYKLGLIRSLARIADLSPGLAAAPGEDDTVEVAAGAVALAWVQAYLPLVAAGLPQVPRNRGPDGLAFCGPGFQALLAQDVKPVELRVGQSLGGERADALAAALREARDAIARMPVRYIHYADGRTPVFTARSGRPPRLDGPLILDAERLWSYGGLRVPGHLWRAMQRLGPWIEPVLLAEWGRLVQDYGEGQGQPVAPGTVEALLSWQEPERGTRIARLAAARLLEGPGLTCVWSGTRLSPAQLDIDHCLPWSAWPCGDLWNLLPASRRLNQHQKRDRLPSPAALSQARGRVIGWWTEAWLADAALRERFEREAAAALPLSGPPTPETAFEGLAWRRLRLAQDQQLTEWSGVGPGV